MTDQERHELKHRLSECAKAADWYRGTPRAHDTFGTDIIYLYETVAMLGRALQEREA